ncbi:MAG: multiprotein-bridging factor 1 family protein [Candidatus Micrarchaeaceae archaeon]
MEACEICGKETSEVYEVEVGGAKLIACKDCAKTAKGAKRIGAEEKPRAKKTKERKENEKEIVEGYGKIIKEARQRMGLELKVLAEKINEKESYLLRVEQEKTLPNETLVKKLEKELGIKLVKETEEVKGKGIGKKEDLTIGDFAE